MLTETIQGSDPNRSNEEGSLRPTGTTSENMDTFLSKTNQSIENSKSNLLHNLHRRLRQSVENQRKASTNKELHVNAHLI